MKAWKHSPTEAEERAKFESWYKATKDFEVCFDGYLHPTYGIWFYNDKNVNAAWHGWRERAHYAGSFKAIPSMDPAYKALEMIAEWRKGCSCAAQGKPEECHECTRSLIDALERHLQD